MQGLSCLDVACKGFARVDGMHRQPTASKLAVCLNEQVEPVNDEVKLGDDAPALEIIGQKTGVLVGQCSLAAALSVPDDALADTRIKFALNRLGGEELRVTHDVLVQAIGLVHIVQRILQQE